MSISRRKLIRDNNRQGKERNFQFYAVSRSQNVSSAFLYHSRIFVIRDGIPYARTWSKNLPVLAAILPPKGCETLPYEVLAHHYSLSTIADYSAPSVQSRDSSHAERAIISSAAKNKTGDRPMFQTTDQWETHRRRDLTKIAETDRIGFVEPKI